MNIFILDQCPVLSAQMLCDKHIVKMILETAQILCTVARKNGHDMKYKSTHKNHPCTLWAGESLDNWNWLIDHGIAMSKEYSARYNRRHASQDVIEACKNLALDLPSGSTPFALAMPNQYKCPDPVKSYRNYYRTKAHFAAWNHSEQPDWWDSAA